PPPPGLVPSCAEGGVLGVLPGIIGSLQAIETIKLITGIGEPMINRLLIFDALKMKFRELKLKKNNDCVVCSDHPTVTTLIDYEQFCGAPSHDRMEDKKKSPAVSTNPYEITVHELKARLDRGDRPFLLDVRNLGEYQICHLVGATLIPVNELPLRFEELPDRDAEIVAICKVGVRSANAVQFLKQKGFTKVKNLLGGMDALATEIDPAMPRS
ncbi:MAG: molybdenum cofactor biosynthesis protein MoeB, partial [Desulfobulbaceae bacterium]|nr:molybdenum cofactor biosynthesis protein MoeB [Desulfobulbaceae bacterium]